MYIKKTIQSMLVIVLVATLLAACGGGGGGEAKPPAAGDYVAAVDFGELVFTVDETGSKITKMSYRFADWSCGPVTNSGTIEISAEWPITDGKFSIDETFDPGGNQTMNFAGTYSAADQKFTGTWEELSYGEKCSGTWEAAAP